MGSTSMSPPWTAVFPPCSNWSLGDQGPKYQMLNWNILKENMFWFFLKKNDQHMLTRKNSSNTMLPSLFTSIESKTSWQIKKCQRYNGPKGWVLPTKITSFGHKQVLTQILIKFHLQNLDQASTSKSQPNISISTKLKLQIMSNSFRISTKIKLHNLNQGSAAKYWPNFSFKISPEIQLHNLDQTFI